MTRMNGPFEAISINININDVTEVHAKQTLFIEVTLYILTLHCISISALVCVVYKF
jgi:hypothetical protein